MRTYQACLASVAVALCASVASVPAYAADDVGSNPITEFFDGLGLGTKEKPDIEYKERAPLVPPTNTAALPAPLATAGTRDAQWPQDPDVQARAERRANANKVHTETYGYRMDRSPRMDPDELGNRRTAGASVSRGAADATRGDNEITRSSRDEMTGQVIRQTSDSSAPARSRLTDPPPGYMSGNGVTAAPAAEQKPWYGRIFGGS